MSVSPELFLPDPDLSTLDVSSPKDVTISHYWAGPLAAAFDAATLVVLGPISATAYEYFASGFETGRRSYLGVSCVVASLTVALFKSRGLYNRSSVLGQDAFLPIVKTWLLVFALLAGGTFLLGLSEQLSRGVLVVYFTTGGVTLMGTRHILRGYVQKSIDSGSIKGRRVLLIGDRQEVSFADPGPALRCHGYSLAASFLYDSAQTEVGPDDQLPWGDIMDAARSGGIDEIVVAGRWSEIARIETIVDRLRMFPIPIRLLPDRATSRYLARPMTDIGLAMTIDLQRGPLAAWQSRVKTTVDFVTAAGALVAFSPMLLVIAAMIKLDSPGPVFFRQTRVGFNGRPFRIFKFRTMRTIEDGDEIRQATIGDDRVTPIGRWLRATSVDELPQLINVLCAEMSLVGPRPHAVAHDRQYRSLIANYALRHRVKPGITGWAQVCGLRGETPTVDLMARRIEHDLWYIHNWSFWLDSLIVVRTAVALMRPQNVY